MELEELEKEHNTPKTQEPIFTELEDGGIEVTFFEDTVKDFSYNEDEHYENLVEYVDEDVLLELGQHVLETTEQDDTSRKDWLDMIVFGLDLLGLKIEEKHVPFQGACSAQHPLLMESAVKFQSKASNELLPADGPVKVKVIGEVTPEKEDQALRVKNHLNYQITEEMTEFYPDSEKLLLYVALVGSGFKKTYYSSHLERPVSEFVTADQFIVPHSATDLFRSPRYTHVLYKTKHELEADFAAGLYKKPCEDTGLTLGEPTQPKISEVQKKTQEITGITSSSTLDSTEVYTLYEQHVDCYIEGLDERDSEYELASPYIITVDAATGIVLGIRRNWKKGDTKRIKKMMFTHFGFVPGFGFYNFGYLHLLGNLQLSLTSALRSLVDAGQFANLQGGFKLKGVKLVDDGEPIVPGQFKDIEAMVQDINKAIMPLPFKGADQTLYAMLEFLDRKGQKFADSTEQVLADATNQGPVGTTLALLDASTKFFSAVHKRLHASLKNELKIISEINSETLSENNAYNLNNETKKVTKEDYNARVDVVPVSDANVSSSAHRMAKAQTMLQIALQTPDLHDMKEVLRHVYVNMDYTNVDKILPKEEEAKPNDPITDIIEATKGRPIKAFEGQDHESHIRLKQAFLQDPQSGGNLLMQKARVAIQANIQEHMLLSFVEQTNAVAQLNGGDVISAAEQLAIQNQQKLQQEQEQQKQDDPAMLLAQAELLDTQTQARKQAFEEQYKAADLELKKEKIDLEVLKEIRRAEEFDQELINKSKQLVDTKALDAMVKALDK